jgi:DNA-binding transcriptional LysR family regulator
MLSNRLLRQFIAVAEELNYHRASARVQMAQSPLSQAIRKLESYVGVALFVRSKRNVALTAAGRVFLDEARASLKRDEQAVLAARQAAQGESGSISLGFVGSVGYDVLPVVIKNFHARFPHINVDLNQLHTSDQLERLRTHQLDVGIARPPIPDDRGIASRLIKRDRLIVALPRSHRLAGADAIALGDLRQDPFVLFSRTLVEPMYIKVLTACQDAGFYPHFTYEVQEVPSAIGVVASGTAVALLPACLRVVQHTDVIYKDLLPPASSLVLDTVIIWREGDPHAALNSFLNTLPAAW